MSSAADLILEQLNKPLGPKQTQTPILDLLARYDPARDPEAWDNDPDGPRLYRWFAKKLIDQGYPTTALRLARQRLDREIEAVERSRGEKVRHAERPTIGDPVLRYMVGLAFARGGNPGSAERYVVPLRAEVLASTWAPPPGVGNHSLFRCDVAALRGRLYKDGVRQLRPSERQRELARLAADEYELAATLTDRNAFPLGNAATMRYVAGDAEQARALAERAERQAQAEGAGRPNDYWSIATSAEAALVAGNAIAARERYQHAVDLMLKPPSDRGSLTSLLANLRLLIDSGLTGIDIDWIAAKIGTVVVFSGHRIDPPWFTIDGRPSRFPNDHGLIKAVKAEIVARLSAMNARFGFCSLASGADILFAEAMIDRGADLQVVLPFAEKDFLRLSVDYGCTEPEWQAWATRYHAVLAHLSPYRDALYYVTEEPYLGSHRLFGYANEVVQGIGTVRARQLGVPPRALILLDPAAVPTPGGAAHFRELWEKQGHRTEVIDLAEFRGEWPAVRAVQPPQPDKPPALERPVRAMMFADVAGFSRLKDEFAPQFFQMFTGILGEALARSGRWVLHQNTWGDGVFAVFGGNSDGTALGEATATGAAIAAEFALQLVEAFGRERATWQEMGFADSNPLRIGLHIGPVFEIPHDPVLGRRSFFGQHITRTARIEPITLPGTVYASEQFAALLTVTAPERFVCEFVGLEPLAKGYSSAPLYRISQRPGPSAST